MKRLFVAIKFNEEEQLALLCNQSKQLFRKHTKIKWVEEQNLHLTLFFIGEVENETALKIQNEFEQRFKYIKPVSLEYDGNFIFYHKHIPKVIGIRFKSNEYLTFLKQELNDMMKKFKIHEEERNFIPHLTFGRVKQIASMNEFDTYINLQFPITFITVSVLCLFESTLNPSGPVYTPLIELNPDSNH